MKLLITGGRHLNPAEWKALLTWYYDHANYCAEIWHGGAQGGDQMAAQLADHLGAPERIIKPDYSKHPGHKAPLMRNTELVERTTHTLALHDGELSNGTADTVRKSKAAGHPTWALNVNTGEAVRLK